MGSVELRTLLVALFAAFCQAAIADQAADEAAIRKSVEAYVAAYNGGDAKALAGMWSPDAVYTDPLSGEQAVGRAAIEQQFASIFADSSGAKLSATTHSVEFISPGVAIERGAASVARPNEEPEVSEYTAVYLKRDGQWLLDRVSEEDAAAPPSNYEHLKELEWMIGTWVDQDDQATVETTCQWTKNRNFITRMFSVSIQGRIEVSGMQLVGWDPGAKQIRSWVFDSDGGFGEGVWSRKGSSWRIQSTGTAPDGSASSSVNIITYVDDDTFTWQSINRFAGDELLPNVDEIVAIRQAPPE